MNPGQQVKTLSTNLDDYVDTEFANFVNMFSNRCHTRMIEAEFHDPPKSVPHLCGMVVTELAELIEVDRVGGANEVCEKVFPNGVSIGITKFEEEVADAMIRLMDFADLHKLNIGRAMQIKQAYNETRPKKHGKKY